MNGPYLTFMLVPCVSAICVGWAARHWALAAAAISGGLGGAFLLVSIASPTATFLVPIATAATVSGLILIPALLWRPTISVWNRMMFSLGAVFVTHLAFLQYTLAA